LARRATQDVRTDGYKGLVALAKELGIHDEQGQLTDKGVQVARSALPLEATVTAAKEQGYSGTDASAFDRGARGEKGVTLGSIAELKAFNDGRDWALNRDAKNAPIPNTATDTETAAIVDKSTAKQDGVGKVSRQAVTSTGVPEKQRNMQFLNQAVDHVYGATLKPSEQAQLKQMVKKGATAEQLDQAAQKMRGGETVLANPAPEAKPFRGEVIERGPLIRARERAQAAIAAQQEALLRRSAEGQTKAQMTQARIEHERYKGQLREAINEAVQDGSLSRKEHLDRRQSGARQLQGDRGPAQQSRSASIGASSWPVSRRSRAAGITDGQRSDASRTTKLNPTCGRSLQKAATSPARSTSIKAGEQEPDLPADRGQAAPRQLGARAAQRRAGERRVARPHDVAG
jgi:hypothetical protein